MAADPNKPLSVLDLAALAAAERLEGLRDKQRALGNVVLAGRVGVWQCVFCEQHYRSERPDNSMCFMCGVETTHMIRDIKADYANRARIRGLYQVSSPDAEV